MAQKIDILGISIDDMTLQEALDRVEEIVAARKPEYFSAINLHQIVVYKENERFKNITDRAGLLTVDGQPVMWLAKLLKTPFKEKITGEDFVPVVCRMAAEKGYSVFFFGGAPGAAEKAVENLRKTSPQLKVAGTYSPPFGFEKDEAELSKINAMLKDSGADLLFVGMSSPKRDFFIDENKEIYQIPLSFSVGIVIDYLAGSVKQPPKWMRDVGLAWFYRFCSEPRRLFYRYFVESWKVVGYYFEYKKNKLHSLSGGGANNK